MKTPFVLLIIFIAMTVAAFQEGERTILITDIRDRGGDDFDTTTLNYSPGEVKINRVLNKVTKYYTDGKPVLGRYAIHFYKLYEGRLVNYPYDFVTDENYENASYKWLNDTVISITFIKPEPKNNKNIRLVQRQNKAVLVEEKKEER